MEKKVSSVPLVKKMVKRLSKAASNEKIKKTMEAEDMIDRLINRETEEKLKIQAKEFEEKLEQKNQELNYKDQELSNKERELSNKERENNELKRQLEAFLKMKK